MFSIVLLIVFGSGCFLLFLYSGKTPDLRARLAASPVAVKIRDIRRSGTERQLEQELSECLSYIKNMVALGRGGSMSGELLMEELSAMTTGLSSCFQDMAYCLHVNDREGCAAALSERIRKPYAKDIGAFLAGWEDIAPEDLVVSIEIYRSAIREERETALRKEDEMMSDLIYFPVVANAMAVLLNFIYIAYFIQQKDMLTLLFR